MKWLLLRKNTPEQRLKIVNIMSYVAFSARASRLMTMSAMKVRCKPSVIDFDCCITNLP